MKISREIQSKKVRAGMYDQSSLICTDLYLLGLLSVSQEQIWLRRVIWKTHSDGRTVDGYNNGF